ncbi:expressed unknown protein [Seminavis robusta]|uniref:Uncharacterized protein n=1 Tax=Seminavis robusta TaxID=568900 RepID=A0A9N8E5E3_9STRA|nr:expressed unknown protein [Seminavis robusta]|eukprot:Sro691_g187760.1 n/a (242) ;mRNA; f:8059-8784
MSLSSKPTPSEEHENENLNPNLSDYERKRAQNIVRNNERLLSLGLISSLEATQSNAAAWGLQVPACIRSSASSTTTDNEKESTKLKKRKSIKESPLPPSRKSARLQGKPAEENVMLPNDDKADNESTKGLSTKERRLAIIQECRQARLKAAARVMEEGEERAAKQNPTATYAHCSMRVRTMTEKGLKNRVKTIERAAGKHCVVKMAIFKSCLQDEDEWDLANLASEALERLKAMQPPPVES